MAKVLTLKLDDDLGNKLDDIMIFEGYHTASSAIRHMIDNYQQGVSSLTRLAKENSDLKEELQSELDFTSKILDRIGS